MRTYTMNQKTKKEENMVSENLTPLPSSTKNNKCEYHDNETELLALKRLDETSTRLQKQGNYLEALECMEVRIKNIFLFHNDILIFSSQEKVQNILMTSVFFNSTTKTKKEIVGTPKSFFRFKQ